jgi:hypothetical protein
MKLEVVLVRLTRTEVFRISKAYCSFFTQLRQPSFIFSSLTDFASAVSLKQRGTKCGAAVTEGECRLLQVTAVGTNSCGRL